MGRESIIKEGVPVVYTGAEMGVGVPLGFSLLLLERDAPHLICTSV